MRMNTNNDLGYSVMALRERKMETGTCINQAVTALLGGKNFPLQQNPATFGAS